MKNIEIKIGALVITVVLFTITALLYVGYKKDLFAKRISYTVLSHTAERLFNGMPVKFEGFAMGDVSRIELNDEGKFVLTLSILEKYQKWIKSDSRVFFNQESVIGKPYLRFTAGSKDEAMMPENSVFTLEFEGGIDELIKKAEPVIEDLGQIVWNIRLVTDDFVDPDGSLLSFLSYMESVGYKMDRGRGIVPYLIGSREGKEKLDAIMDRLIGIQDNIKRLSLELDNTVVNKVNPILDDISRTTKDLYLLRRKGEYTLDLSSDLLLKVNNTWPFAPDDKKRETPRLPSP
jgi:hypothetical protein